MATETGWRPLQRPVRATGPDPTLAASPFSRLAVTHLLSAAGDALVTLALAGTLFFSISPNAARGRVALSLVMTIAPFALVAPFLGPAMDRLQRGRRFIVLGAAVGRVVAAIHNLLLFPAAFFALVFSKLHYVAKCALVPAVVTSDDELVAANSKLTIGAALVGLLAGVVGAVILKTFNAGAVLRVAAIVFFATAILSLRIAPAREDRTPPHETGGAVHKRTWGITLAAAVMAVLRGMVGFLTFLLAFDLRRTHAPAWWFGIVLAASVAGGMLGALVAPRVRGRVREEHIVIGALVLVVVCSAAAAWWGGRGAATLVTAVLGLSAGAAKLAFDSLVQRDGHEATHGRLFARFEAGFQLVWVFGALIPVLLYIPAEAGFIVMAVVSAAAAVGYAAVRLRPPAIAATS